MKRKRENKSVSSNDNMTASPCWVSLDNDILVTAISYCNAADLWTLRHTCSVFRHVARLAVSRAECLHLSVFHDANAKCKDGLVACLLHDTHRSLQRLELSGLRHVRGESWLERVLWQCQNLTTLDFSGCATLDPRLLERAIESSKANVYHLNLTGCRRVNGSVVRTVLKTWNELETLQLGGCSQTIDEDCLQGVENFGKLRTLDLTGLTRITNRHGVLFCLPPSLECLYLGGCERVTFASMYSLLYRVKPLLTSRLHEGTLHELSEFLQRDNMDALWSVLYPILNEELRDHIHNIRGNDSLGMLKSGWRNLRLLDLGNCGIAQPGRGLCSGLVGFLSCFSGGSLREVNVSGCDNVTDEDIRIMAATCGKSLTCLEARACRIGDASLMALGQKCEKLAFLDLSACYNITDEGFLALVPRSGAYVSEHLDGTAALPLLVHMDIRGCPALKTLKVSNLPNLTDKAMLAIGGMFHYGLTKRLYQSNETGLKKLLLLDVRDCTNISAESVDRMMIGCPSLIEIESRGINGRVSRDSIPKSLRFLNGRRLLEEESLSGTGSLRCCTVMKQSQRLKASQNVTLQPMFHCYDCSLLPSGNRGMCSVCAAVCHEGHRTFFGSMERYYCDCAFGISGGDQCKALVCGDNK